MQVKTLQKRARRAYRENRTEAGPYRSFEISDGASILTRRRHALIRAGCCDSLPAN